MSHKVQKDQILKSLKQDFQTAEHWEKLQAEDAQTTECIEEALEQKRDFQPCFGNQKHGVILIGPHFGGLKTFTDAIRLTLWGRNAAKAVVEADSLAVAYPYTEVAKDFLFAAVPFVAKQIDTFGKWVVGLSVFAGTTLTPSEVEGDKKRAAPEKSGSE